MSTGSRERARHTASSSTCNSSVPSTKRRSVSSAATVSTAVPIEEDIARKPWKYIGYKGYTDFVALENDFYIVRRYGARNARIALALQDQVAVLEEELERLDKQYSRVEAEDINNGSFRDDADDRIELLMQIHKKVVEYSMFR
jgi:hypothetical protein